MSGAQVHAQTNQLAGHAPTSPGSCETPAQSLMNSLGKLNSGGLGGLSSPASCPPGSVPLKCNAPIGAPIHPGAQQSLVPAHPAAAKMGSAMKSNGAAAAAAAAAPAPQQYGSPVSTDTYATPNEMLQAMNAYNKSGLSRQDLHTIVQKSNMVRVVRVPIDLNASLNKLAANPEEAVFNVPWNVIANGEDIPARGALLSVAVKSKTGGKACGVRLNVDNAASTTHMEYNPKHKAHAITWFGPNEDARMHSPSGEVRFQRSWKAPLADALKYSGIEVSDMFNPRDCVPTELGNDKFFQVKIDSMLGKSMVKTADAEAALPAGSEKTFVTHPNTWKIFKLPNGAWWSVDPSSVNKMRETFTTIKDNEGLENYQNGINITASRADGRVWNDPADTVNDLEGNAQADVLNYPSPCKAELELAFLVPAPVQSK